MSIIKRIGGIIFKVLQGNSSRFSQSRSLVIDLAILTLAAGDDDIIWVKNEHQVMDGSHIYH